MQQWTDGQWVVFFVTIAAGLAAMGLAWRVRSAVLGWTAPAPMRYAEHPSTPRPSIVMTERRELASSRPMMLADYIVPPMWHDMPIAGPGRELPIIVGEWSDPMAADYSSHGVGALRDLLEVDADPALKTSAELAAEEAAWINAYADLSALMPQTDRARAEMNTAIEPMMRRARRWLYAAGEGSPGRRGLTEWRIGTPTGEYPAVDRQYMIARALLVS